MRRFADANGRSWDATIGKESYGTLVVLFAPAGGGEPRKSVLAAETAFQAEDEFARLTEDQLRALLADAVPAL